MLFFFKFNLQTIRVKELGPGGPVEGKPSDVVQDYPVDGTSPQNSDLALLKTSNVSLYNTFVLIP